jgi:hypothetical protein
MNGYVWYSFGSDTTGPKLAEALGFKSGKKTPDVSRFEVVLGWGCKLGEKYDAELFKQRIQSGALRVLNTPETVEANRDKLAMLLRLQAKKVSTPGLVSLDKKDPAMCVMSLDLALKNGVLAYPIVGMSSIHKGEPFFCHTREDVVMAVVEIVKQTGAFYFRSLCAGTEYRIHVLRDQAILAQIKAPAKNPLEATVKSMLDDLKHGFEKEEKIGFPVPDARAQEWIVKMFAPEMLRGPSQLLRSTNRGWSLEDCPLSTVPAFVVTEAIKAIDASGLDMGVVSLVIDEKVARVTNITTSPALSDKHLAAYVSAIKDFAAAVKKPAKAKTASAPSEIDQAPQELITRLNAAIRGLSRKKAEAVLSVLGEE